MTRPPEPNPPASGPSPGEAPSLGLLMALWRRELLRLRRERSRWFGIALQPLLFWVILGAGFSPSFRLDAAPGVGYSGFFFPGTIVMVVLFTAIFSTITVIEDRQSGFLQGVLVAPGARPFLVLGKLLGITTIVALQCALFVALAPLAGIVLGEVAWIALVVAIVLTSLLCGAIGMTLAWLLPTSQSYHAIMSILLLPMWVVSGALFPPGDGAMAVIVRLNPLSYAVSAVRGAMIPALADGLWTNITILAAVTSVFVAITAAACRRSGGRPS